MYNVTPRLQHAIILAREQKQWCEEVSHSRVKHFMPNYVGMHQCLSCTSILQFLMSRSDCISVESSLQALLYFTAKAFVGHTLYRQQQHFTNYSNLFTYKEQKQYYLIGQLESHVFIIQNYGLNLITSNKISRKHA